jgi:hypothetical protein
LPLAKKVHSWELKSVPVAAEEGYLRTWTPQGLAMSPDPGDLPSRLVGDLHAVFDAPAKQATLAYINEAITNLNDPAKYKLHMQGGFPTVVGQFMLDVDRTEIRVGGPSPLEGGDRAEGTLINAPGGADPRVVLLRFAGTPGGALNLSKMVCQVLITSMAVYGVRAALVNAHGEKLSTFNSGGVLPGNTKNQFISMRRRADGFTIDYETESPLATFSKGGKVLELDDNASWLKFSMQIWISAADLEAGNLIKYRVTLPPEVAIHTEMTTASLARQTRGA